MRAKGGVLYAATVFALILPPCFLQAGFFFLVCYLQVIFLLQPTLFFYSFFPTRPQVWPTCCVALQTVLHNHPPGWTLNLLMQA